MNIKKIIQETLESVEGASGVGLIGMDGMVIDRAARDNAFAIAETGAGYSGILKNFHKSSMNFGFGATTEALLATDKLILLLAAVGKDYFLALHLQPDGNLGRARLELKKAAFKIEKELT